MYKNFQYREQFKFFIKLFLWFCLCGFVIYYGNLINKGFWGTLILVFSIVGMVYSFVSFCAFIMSDLFFLDRKYKEKAKLCMFTIVYMLIFVIFTIYFRGYFHLIEYDDIVKFIKDNNSLNLITLMTSDLLMAAGFLLFYLYFCWKIVGKFRILLFTKWLRSVLVAFTAWLLIATNIDIIATKYNEINKLLIVFYIIVSSVTTLLYPFFDTFEFTYKKIFEHEKEQEEREKRERIENESNGSKNYTAW